MSFRHSTAIALSLLLVTGCSSDGEADGGARRGAQRGAQRAVETGADRAVGAAIVAPGTLSTDAGESWISFDPTQQIAVFGRHDSGWGDHTVYVARRTADGWTEPRVTPFSGQYADRGARLTADGAVLFYSSNRPRADEGEEAQDDFDIWLIQLLADGWGPPRPLPAPLNSDANEIHPSVAVDGTVYFASDREGGLGRSDLYAATPGPSGYAVESLGPVVNTEHSEPDVYVDPQQRFIIFARTDDPEGYGGDDLWFSMRTEDGWSAPRNLGPEVNSSEYEYGPTLSADGRTLYFTSHRDGDADIFAIEAARAGIQVSETN